MKDKLYLLISIFLSLFIALGTNYSCPWRKYFHIYCAGCGVTRMIMSIIKLDFYQAFMYNQLFFILLLFGIIYLGYVAICKLFHISFYKLSDKCLWLLLILVISYTILRNVNYFSFLRPMKV